MLGKPVADFSLPSTGGTFRLKDERGKRLALCFHPQVNTPGCTEQGMDFRDAYPAFRKAGVAICGVTKLKNMYGRKVRGIERSTFLLDEKRVRAREWRGVKVPGHVQEVLNFAKTL